MRRFGENKLYGMDSTEKYKALIEKKPILINGKPRAGVWVPLAIAAFLSNYSRQHLRIAFLEGKIIGCQFKVGPVLVSLESVDRYKNTMLKRKEIVDLKKKVKRIRQVKRRIKRCK